MAGEVLSVTIVDATPIDPASGIGASGSGWAALVVLADITSLVGTVDPSALTLVVQDPGFDTAGNATTVTRTMSGNAHIRRQHPNGNTKIISTDGTNLTLLISSTDWIYAGTTIVSAAIGSTFYTGCVASSAPTRTNSSTITYASIKPKFAWLNLQNERATGNTHYLEGVASHRYARSGQQVACIKYQVTDGTNTSAEVLVSAPSLSVLQTKGYIAEVWPASVDMSAQTQGGMSTVFPRVYPWLGDSTGVLDLATDGYAWPTSLPLTGLRLLCDRTGGYGGALAYIDGVGAGSPAVSTSAVTARANPFANLVDAADAIEAWNNTNRGHADYGGAAIRLMDNAGADRTHTFASGLRNRPGATHLILEKDPLSSATITITPGGGFTQGCPMTVFRNITVAANAASDYVFLGQNLGNTHDALLYDNCSLDNTLNKGFGTWFQLAYLRNITFVGSNSFGLSEKNTAMLIGCVSATTGAPGNDYQPKVVIGCHLPTYHVQMDKQGGEGDHGKFIYNNRVNCIVLNQQTANTLAFGVAVVQNLCEANAIASACHLFGDGDLTTVLDVIDQYNTGVGERSSRFYNDVPASRTAPNGLTKRGVSRACIWDNTNQKVETFNGGGIGSVGTFAYSYGVGNVGNVSLFGMVNRANNTLPSNDNTDNYMGNAWHPGSEPNLFRVAYGYSQADIMDMFTNYTCAPRAAPALGGNYRPLATATRLLNAVPAGLAMLRFDLSGAVRRDDGTAAAGAYESPSVVTLAGTALSVASSTASMSHTVPLAATASGLATSNGQLALTITFTATALAAALSTAALALAKPLAATALGRASGTADLNVTASGDVVDLAANASAVASAGASMSLAINLSASAFSQGVGSGVVLLQVPLGAAALAQAGSGGALSLTVTLGAASFATSSASAALSGPVALAANGVAVATGAAQLQVAGLGDFLRHSRRTTCRPRNFRAADRSQA